MLETYYNWRLVSIRILEILKIFVEMLKTLLLMIMRRGLSGEMCLADRIEKAPQDPRDTKLTCSASSSSLGASSAHLAPLDHSPELTRPVIIIIIIIRFLILSDK